MVLQCLHCYAIKSSAFSFDVAVKYLNTIVDKYPVSLQVDGTSTLHYDEWFQSRLLCTVRGSRKFCQMGVQIR